MTRPHRPGPAPAGRPPGLSPRALWPLGWPGGAPASEAGFGAAGRLEGRPDDLFKYVSFLILLTFIYYWIRDVIREAIKKYEVLPAGLFIVFLIFVFSEGMLFISFFWASFHSSCSPIIEEILYVPDPCELTYTNTLILSNAALSLGCAFICRESNQNLSIISFILAWTFILLQLKEFRNMAFYINDSIFGSIFFFLTGLHFFHVVVGIILISIILGIVSIVSSGIMYFQDKISGPGTLPTSTSYISRYHFIMTFYGILLTFTPMHFLGFNVMPRRIPDFPDYFNSFRR